MKYPEFKSMSKAIKEDLLNRFRPEYCPNCGRKDSEGRVVIVTVQSSVPCWTVTCKPCGAEYQLKMFD